MRSCGACQSLARPRAVSVFASFRSAGSRDSILGSMDALLVPSWLWRPVVLRIVVLGIGVHVPHFRRDVFYVRTCGQLQVLAFDQLDIESLERAPASSVGQYVWASGTAFHGSVLGCVGGAKVQRPVFCSRGSVSCGVGAAAGGFTHFTLLRHAHT